MTQTPLQEALSKLGMMRQAENENVRIALNANEVAVMLNSLLPKEKEFVGKVWDAADKRAAWERHKDRSLLDIILLDEPAPSKHIFLNQLYPEK